MGLEALPMSSGLMTPAVMIVAKDNVAYCEISSSHSDPFFEKGQL